MATKTKIQQVTVRANPEKSLLDGAVYSLTHPDIPNKVFHVGKDAIKIPVGCREYQSLTNKALLVAAG